MDPGNINRFTGLFGDQPYENGYMDMAHVVALIPNQDKYFRVGEYFLEQFDNLVGATLAGSSAFISRQSKPNIGFNANYVLDAVSVFNNRVWLYFPRTERPLIIHDYATPDVIAIAPLIPQS